MVNSTETLAPAPESAHVQFAEVTVSTDNFSLERGDRCDVCSAQAYVRVVFESNSELTFCNHHYRNNESKLLKVAKTIFDESAQLQPKKATAGNGFV